MGDGEAGNIYGIGDGVKRLSVLDKILKRASIEGVIFPQAV